MWNESFQFTVPAGGGKELVTLILWAVSPGDGSRENMGHIAVPASRVAASGKEEGWYEIRKADGQILTGGGAGAKTALLVSLSYTPVAAELPVSSGWCAVLGKDGSVFERRFAVLDPYRQVTRSAHPRYQPRTVRGMGVLAACRHARQQHVPHGRQAHTRKGALPRTPTSNPTPYTQRATPPWLALGAESMYPSPQRGDPAGPYRRCARRPRSRLGPVPLLGSAAALSAD